MSKAERLKKSEKTLKEIKDKLETRLQKTEKSLEEARKISDQIKDLEKGR